MLNLQASTVDPQLAFEMVIDAGILSVNSKAANYAGLFMFMGETDKGELAFKNRNTREYLLAADLV